MADTTQDPSKVFKDGAPDLDPKFERIVNVKKDYPWTLNTNQTLKSYVPEVILTQYKLTNSGELQSIKNTLLGIIESKTATDFAGALAGGVALAGAKEATAAAAVLLTGRAGAAAQTVNNALNAPGADILAAGAGVALARAARKAFLPDVMSPYANLYPANATGYKYILPYLNVESMTEVAGSFRPVDQTNMTSKIGQVVGTAGNVIGPEMGKFTKELANITGGVYRGLKTLSELDLAISEPGTAQEKIKAFAPNDGGDSVNVTFYLYNTVTPELTKKNWQFLFGLTYQNLPYRRSINLLDPPFIYDVVVPGYKRLPIAAIESLRVTNEGTTRVVNLDTGEVVSASLAGSNTNIKIIPEAYKVTIKLTGLLMNTGNLFYYTYDQKSEKINVFKSNSETSKTSTSPSQPPKTENTRPRQSLGGPR